MKRLLVVLVTVAIILTAGWLMLRRPDISYNTLESVYSKSNSRYLKSGSQIELHFTDTGPRDAPILVLVHGYSASLNTWDAWVRNLRKDYRVIRLDLPGHGLSRCVDNDEIGIEQFIASIDRVTHSLDVDQFTLVGSSMGGHTAWAYALAHPDRLDGLVLVDAAGWLSAPGEDDKDPVIFKLLRNGFARNVMKDLDMSALIRSGLENSFADPELVTDEMVERYSAMSRAPCHREALLKIMSGTTLRVPASKERLSAIAVPTLILHGDTDNLIPVAHAEKFADAIPGSKLIIYPETGHIPQEEQPVASVEDFRAFLAAIYSEETAEPEAVEPNGE
ncbi:alpha/beta fold hydrolase [Hyphomonas sp. UBA5107]|uniref:alpha/beta fold hydrolase n=1 Tax=Hyphomonas sp. UBA5107 TaxID=1946636 RepID=UPI000C5E9C44|nr:alpha/beta hydrolase [Hyphomonas sp. UBA5107]MAA80777.1 alpha/beta hydrolase [Hyphomonas sp.]HCN91670.1 alpha/beta hydrolase [Hyphomonas sp.]|tara:strand:- start:1 stop:1002 length:1002 start_codon:yes stop_codon:yes gene_type:complete